MYYIKKIYDIYMVFPVYFGFLDQYNGNIVESGVKYHNPPIIIYLCC